MDSLCEAVLLRLCDLAGAELGTLYVADDDGDGYRLAGSRGLEAGRLPAEIAPGAGLPGRALAERRPVHASPGESGLRVLAFGEEVAVRHELNLPLVQGGRMVGVLTLARLGDREFAAADLDMLEPLADQAAVALSNILAYRSAERLAQRNRIVLDATVGGIFMVDLDGNVVLRNAAIDGLGPARAGSIYGRIDELADETADPDRTREFLRRVAAEPELDAVEEIALAALGRTFLVHTAPVRGDDGALLGRIFTLHDVTAEREADRMKSDLVATVSHELRTPLASILGFSELMTTRAVDEEERGRYLRTIHAEARRLTDLVNDFLDVQRIEEGRLALDLAPFELGELLRQQADLFSGQSEAHTVSLSLPDEPVEVVGAHDRIAQVVGNLISNAIKYSPAGGPVEVTVERRDGRVRVSVGDRGLGIPADQQQRIFTKFFRVDTSDTRLLGGTGLGLALSREIVEAHGGWMGFESAEGRGSTFWFELPAEGRRLGQPRALVIEDDSAAATLLREWLQEDGFAVEAVATGEEGLARAADDPPDVVCLDVRLAGELDGWEVLARLKTAPGTASVPVVVCTGGNGRDRAAALGAADFLAKPVSPEALREAVRRLVPGEGLVLVVDDDPGVRRLVVESLRGLGLELAEAADGEEALAAVADRRPDAVVLDLVMPGLDGFAVLERLQADPSTRTVPVVVLTAKQLSADERARLRSRAVSLLEKSVYSAAELRRLVDLALGR